MVISGGYKYATIKEILFPNLYVGDDGRNEDTGLHACSYSPCNKFTNLTKEFYRTLYHTSKDNDVIST